MIVAAFAVLILCTTRATVDTAECNQALGMQHGKIENEAITASSWKDDDHKPQFARLDSEKAWCSGNETSPYLQISLSEVYKITGIETQGSLSDKHWVTKYEIHYTTNTSGWKVYQASNGKSIFRGNSHSVRPSRNDFGVPLVANAIRIYPNETIALFERAKRACLRVEIYGCKFEVPPSFTRTPKKRIFLLIGRNLTIECNASGVPKPTVKWTGSLLGPTQGRSKQQDGRLSIRNVQINDSGNYTCEASNKEGVVNTTTELVVAEYYFSRSDSVILSGHPDYEQKLNEYLEPVQVSGKQWKLCYRASEHNYRSAAFHTSCDRKGATVTLVRVGVYIFGGYADKSWDAPSDGSYRRTYSDRAFLFSLKNHLNEQFKMFTYRLQQHAMYNRNSWGPVFGDGDIAIADRCNVDTDSISNLGFTYKPPNGYTYGSLEARKLLAGSFRFKCDEYEVYYQE